MSTFGALMGFAVAFLKERLAWNYVAAFIVSRRRHFSPLRSSRPDRSAECGRERGDGLAHAGASRSGFRRTARGELEVKSELGVLRVARYPREGVRGAGSRSTPGDARSLAGASCRQEAGMRARPRARRHGTRAPTASTMASETPRASAPRSRRRPPRAAIRRRSRTPHRGRRRARGRSRAPPRALRRTDRR